MNTLTSYDIHSTKILKGHRYISHRVYAMTLQLWHAVFSRCFDKLQWHLQQVLSKIQFTISNENELCPGPIGIHGLKNENWEFLKFIRNQISSHFYMKYQKTYCQSVKHFNKHVNIPLCPIFKNNQFPGQEKKNFWKICIFLWKPTFSTFLFTEFNNTSTV